jgi:hypothetical protein
VPIKYQIDHRRRLVITRGHGVLTERDLLEYQNEVWSRPEVAGFDELIDMSSVGEFVEPTAERVRELASVSASMDAEVGGGKLAIVAPQDIAYGLGRMYQVYRGMDIETTKQVAVFRTRAAALEFLGLEGQLLDWDNPIDNADQGPGSA